MYFCIELYKNKKQIKEEIKKRRKDMKMKRIILTLTMLVALVATASAQAEIKFDKLIHLSLIHI